MSAVRAAKRLFKCADRILFMSATMGDLTIFLKNLGIKESDAEVHKAPCNFKADNRKIIYRNLGSMSKNKGQPGLPGMLKECSRILKERPDKRGIIHCHSRDLQNTVAQHLRKEFGDRILTHLSGTDRNAGITRLRNSRNGVLCAVAMTEGLDLRDDEARFCIFAKIPWRSSDDPYVAERKKRSQQWYENVTALSVVQGSGRVVRNVTDYAETFIFDSSFSMLVPYFPDWWMDAVHFLGKA
jgi:Rad3-related DNA helicase